MLAYTLVATLLAQPISGGHAEVSTPADDAAVIVAVLDQLHRKGRGFVILSASSATVPNEPERPAHVPVQAFRSMLQRSRVSSALPAVRQNEAVHIIPAAEIAKAFDSSTPQPGSLLPDDRWNAFFQYFPGCTGLATVSFPGYSRDRSKAVIYVTFGTGSLSGQGGFYLLARREEKWVVVDYFGMWVA